MAGNKSQNFDKKEILLFFVNKKRGFDEKNPLIKNCNFIIEKNAFKV